MKRFLPYLVCFAAAFLLFRLAIPHMLMLQETFALFLCTPDWLRDTFTSPWPLTHIVANMLLQFFHYSWGGPLVLSLLVTFIVWLCTLPFRKRRQTMAAWCTTFALLVIGTYLLCTGHIQARERLCKVEYATLHYDWQTILHTATPEAVSEDRTLLPYALLALTETGALADRMFTYPIESIDDFFPKSWYSCSQLLFGSMLYERMGSLNEAIHLTMQAGDALPHGTSFGILRRLATLNRLQGNDTLADKYLYLLGKSTLHASHPQGAYPRNNAAHTFDAEQGTQKSSQAPVVHDEWFYNVTAMLSDGASSPTLLHRSLCGMLARRDLERFVQLWNTIPHAEGETVPTHYREALLLADPSTKEQAKGRYTQYYLKARKTAP